MAGWTFSIVCHYHPRGMAALLPAALRPARAVDSIQLAHHDFEDIDTASPTDIIRATEIVQAYAYMRMFELRRTGHHCRPQIRWWPLPPPEVESSYNYQKYTYHRDQKAACP